MFKIKDDVFHVTRGDKGTVELSIDDYTFQNGDRIEFRVYKKNGMNKPPVLEIIVNVEQASESIDINFASQDTKIGTYINTRKEYWYEVELNNDETIIGFDENGPKIFWLYPEGVEENE